MRYKQTATGIQAIIDNGDGTFTYKGLRENFDGWEEYQAWVAQGNTPEPQFTQEELDDTAAEEQRITEIEIKKEASGLKRITVAQAHQYIDRKFDEANNAAQLKEAIREILKKMVVHIIN